MKHGSLLATRSDYTNPSSPSSFLYLKEGSRDKCPLDGNPQNLACIIRSEFPDGANRAFIQQEIIKLLCVFGSRGQPVDKEIQEDSLELADATIRSDDVLSKQLLELMETPTATFRGDKYWSVRYLAFDSAGLDICFVEGTLKPFDILQPRRYSIAESPHFFTRQKLERALAAKSAALEAERAIRATEKATTSDGPQTPRL